MTFDFILFEGGYDYSKYIFLDLANDPNSYVLTANFSGVKGQLNRVHTSVKLNSMINLPLKNIWYKEYTKDITYDENKQYIILFSESNRLSYDPIFVKWMKNKYHAKTVFFFMNSVVQLPKGRVEYVIKTFDYIVSYDLADCEKYGWNYYCGVYCSDKRRSNRESEIDVFFVGRNKGRLAELKKAYHLFINNGLKCEFYIIDVPNDEIDDSGIHYNHSLKYEETLDRVASCKVLYENLQQNQTGCTLRTYEAICYQKLLVTNNDILENTRIYDEKNMQIYSSTEDINIDAIKKYKYQPNGISAEDLSPKLFLNFLEDIVHA